MSYGMSNFRRKLATRGRAWSPPIHQIFLYSDQLTLKIYACMFCILKTFTVFYDFIEICSRVRCDTSPPPVTNKTVIETKNTR